MWNTAPPPADQALAQLRAYFPREAGAKLKHLKPATRGQNGAPGRRDLAHRYGGLEEKLGQSPSAARPHPLTLAANKVTLFANPAGPVNKEPWVLAHHHPPCRRGRARRGHQTPYVICSSEMYGEQTALCAGAGQVRIVRAGKPVRLHRLPEPKAKYPAIPARAGVRVQRRPPIHTKTIAGG